MWTPVFKDLSKDELKSYSYNHGFVFTSNVKTSDEKISIMCEVLKVRDFTSEYPEFVVRIDELTTAFIYLGDDYHADKFVSRSDLFNRIGIGHISSLLNAL